MFTKYKAMQQSIMGRNWVYSSWIHLRQLKFQNYYV